MAKITTGYIINLVSSDAMRFDKVVVMMEIVFRSLVLFFVLAGMAWLLLGVKVLAGFLFLVVLIIYFGITGYISARLRSNVAETTDERLSLMKAIVYGIRTVKMYAWELPFMETIKKIRRKELLFTQFRSIISATTLPAAYSSQPITVAICLVAFAATGTELTFYNTFLTVSLVSSLRWAVSAELPTAAKGLSDFFTALRRIQCVLDIEDCNKSSDGKTLLLRKDKTSYSNPNREGLKSTFNTRGPEELTKETKQQTPAILTKTGQVVLKHVSCYWKEDSASRPALRDVSLTVSTSELVLVTGMVGSGKSSLLLAVLHELPLSQGELLCSGKVSYAAQKPWIFAGTVRENILFGKEMDRDRYNMAINSCELETDIARFPYGDLTVIGERGVMLSGGQKSRVGLAREIYMNADVYLLDDPLSAVDAKVGRKIFEKCICGVLSQKTRILSTHQLHLHKNADRVIVMKDGSLAQEGSHDELLEAGLDLDALESSIKDNVASEVVARQDHRESLASEDSVGLEIKSEDRMTGSVSSRLYWEYFRAGSNSPAILLLAVFFCFAQVSLVVSDWWLLKIPRDYPAQSANLTIYSALVVTAVVLLIIRAWLFFYAVINSSQILYNRMLSSVMKAPVLFHDTNPVGRILNRFSNDIDIMDNTLPDTFLEAIQLVLYSIGSVVLPTVLNPWVALGSLPLVIAVTLIGRYYVTSSRELSRLEAQNKSPVLSHFTGTIEGLPTIKAHKMEAFSLDKFCRYQDNHSRAWILLQSSMRWMMVRVEFSCALFVFVVFYASFATQSGPGLTVLSIVYALQASSTTARRGVRMCCEVENAMTSVERVFTYTKLEPETGYQSETHPPDNWPESGSLRVENLSLVYYPGGPEVLKGISFSVKAQERVGVVGRTGAGKSSLVSALFRMPEPTGHIIIDGVDTGNLNIQSCRQAISVIAQDPVLFNGTLRLNLDPFENYGDYEIWEALEKAHSNTLVKNLPKQLLHQVEECGSNFSVGERQLLCLARTLLRRNKIIVLDEATASVDYRTDRLIQETIRTKFQGCTVITIAHRLNTVIDYDRILVLEDGKVVEFDEPEVLLSKEDGYLTELYRNYCTKQTANK